MQRIVIDTDPGVDDALAIMLAYAQPGVKVEAIMSVNGNVSLEHTTANACTLLDLLNQETPIYPGCSCPLVTTNQEDASCVNGMDGFGNANFPPSSRKPQSEHASNALVRLASASPGELILVAIGPLTNIAVALKLDPDLPQKIKKLVIMGGAIHSYGNTSNISTEFNVYSDPEAAHEVFGAWPLLTMVSWETTMAHRFDSNLIDKWFTLNTIKSEFFKRTHQHAIQFLTNIYKRKLLFSADSLTMAVALDPAIVQKTETHALLVELQGKYTRGQTTVDWGDVTQKPKNVEIILEVDHARLIQLIEKTLK